MLNKYVTVSIVSIILSFATISANAASVYLNDSTIEVSLLNPLSLTGGRLSNVIDAPSAEAQEFHSGLTHAYVQGSSSGMELRFDLKSEYNMEVFHLWNFEPSEAWDAETFSIKYWDSNMNLVGTKDTTPVEMGNTFAQDFDLGGVSGVQFADVLLMGSNGNVDIMNIGFTASPVPIPAAAWLFGSGLIGLVGLVKRKHSLK